MRTNGVVVGGAGVVAMALGGILALGAKSNYDDARGRCVDGARVCPADAVRDSDTAYRQATFATVVFLVGTAAAAGGAAILYFAPSSPSSQSAAPARPSAALQVGPGSVGLVGRW